MRATAVLRSVPLLVALASPLGCAVAGLHAVSSDEPVARTMLAPEYRVFYDALADYGDWVLIEPAGFVFRPRVTWNQWRPFADGYWAPTDTWGWVWISAEPFGWATYHYGTWFYDDYQGWVWKPGIDWSPGGVSWLIAGDYVGWGPGTLGLDRFGSSAGNASRGMSFAPIADLGTTDLRSHLVPADQVGPALREATPVQNVARVEGLTINRGPSFDLVEARSGPLVRARIEDLVPGDLGRRVAGTPTRRPAGAPGRAERDSAAAAAQADIDLTRRAAERASSEARQLQQISRPNPSVLPMVRPLFGRRGAAPAGRRGEDGDRGAAADSTR